MFCAVICRDRPGALQIRLNTRAAHLAYIEATGIVRMAGPFIEAGQMVGSLVILECESLAEAQSWAQGDPYRAADLFAAVSVTEWKKVIG
ncbi:YciI family protein [Phaeovulum sp.]|uniref:YciI family protein n=1 Tax=Phaeovulum sp. TaxID=2934796 RepID=UPI002731EB81|nr:YciI family protein [Phaeovulum sp.]MDP1669085.1 YciI family protein [Phaeovulum sp.]MDZ4117724.1 YciI family protein [Phaeovulum sp.]